MRLKKEQKLPPNAIRNKIKVSSLQFSFLVVIGMIASLFIVFHYGFAQIKCNTIAQPYQIVPEFNRSLKTIVITLGTNHRNVHLHKDLLLNLPDYTEILLLMPETNINHVENAIKHQPYFQRTRLIGFDTKYFNNGHAYLIFPEQDKLFDTGLLKEMPGGSFWAQDLFEVASSPNGQFVLLISDVHKWFVSRKSDPFKVISDNYFLGSLSSVGFDVKRLPFTFRGGNILVDEFNGKTTAFCGGDIFRLTRTVWKCSKDSVPTDEQIIGMIKNFLNVNKVVVIGKDTVQPSFMFHLDQAMVMLSNGIVGITHIVGNGRIKNIDSREINEVEVFLSKLRSKLSDLNYKLIPINTSLDNVCNYQFYVNGIPYTDANTRQKTYLMPVYPSDQTEFEKYLIKQNTESLTKLGYRVVHVPSEANKFYGGIHCLSNVIR